MVTKPRIEAPHVHLQNGVVEVLLNWAINSQTDGRSFVRNSSST